MSDMYDSASFEEFWPQYRALHSKPETRAVHAVATTAAIGLGVLALKRRSWKLAVAAPLVDYAIAQLAHRGIEGNATQPLRHPWWHVRAEWRMYRETLRLRYRPEPTATRAGDEPPRS